MDEITVFARLEYITLDAEGNIVIGLSKRTYREQILAAIRKFVSREVYICIRRGKWEKKYLEHNELF